MDAQPQPTISTAFTLDAWLLAASRAFATRCSLWHDTVSKAILSKHPTTSPGERASRVQAIEEVLFAGLLDPSAPQVSLRDLAATHVDAKRLDESRPAKLAPFCPYSHLAWGSPLAPADIELLRCGEDGRVAKPVLDAIGYAGAALRPSGLTDSEVCELILTHAREFHAMVDTGSLPDTFAAAVGPACYQQDSFLSTVVLATLLQHTNARAEVERWAKEVRAGRMTEQQEVRLRLCRWVRWASRECYTIRAILRSKILSSCIQLALGLRQATPTASSVMHVGGMPHRVRVAGLLCQPFVDFLQQTARKLEDELPARARPHMPPPTPEPPDPSPDVRPDESPNDALHRLMREAVDYFPLRRQAAARVIIDASESIAKEAVLGPEYAEKIHKRLKKTNPTLSQADISDFLADLVAQVAKRFVTVPRATLVEQDGGDPS